MRMLLLLTGVRGLACLAAGCVLGIVLLLLWLGLPLWQDPATLLALAGSRWNPAAGEYGIAAMLAGTVLLALSALLLAAPCGLLLALFALGLGPRPLARTLHGLLALMAGVPTVVYAFAAVWLLVPWLRDTLQVGMGFSWLAAALTLGLMLIPTVALPLIGALQPAVQRLGPTCAALGLSRVQQLLWVILPAYRHVLLSTLLLASGRAAGDTLIALMLSGNAPWLPHSPADPLRTLSAHIALTLAADTQSTAYAAIYACCLLLLAYTTLIHLLTRKLRTHDQTIC